MNLKNHISLIAVCFSFGAVPEKNNAAIDFEGTYVSRDTICLDQSKPKEITIRLLKFNKDGRVQAAKDMVYNEGEFELCNSNILEYLDRSSSYQFTLKKSKITVECSRKYGQREWFDLATPRRNKISEAFGIEGNTLVRKNKSGKDFGRKYVLNKALTRNHKNIKTGNGC